MGHRYHPEAGWAVEGATNRGFALSSIIFLALHPIIFNQLDQTKGFFRLLSPNPALFFLAYCRA